LGDAALATASVGVENIRAYLQAPSTQNETRRSSAVRRKHDLVVFYEGETDEVIEP
jgi:hypothetical protein